MGLYEKKKAKVNLGITHALGIFSCIYVVHPPKRTLAPKSYRATPMSFSGCIVLFSPRKGANSCFLCFPTSTNKDLLGFRTPLQRPSGLQNRRKTRLPVSHGIAAWPCHHGIANCEQHKGMMHDV